LKYYIKNFYTNTLQIRNTQLRLLRYIRKWNLKHPDKPISRFEIKEIGRIEYKRLSWWKRYLASFFNYFGLTDPFTGVESENNDPITAAKAYKESQRK